MLACPLCFQVSFYTEESLLYALIAFANRKISCPRCPEILNGFDKFTVHFCGHILKRGQWETLNLAACNSSCANLSEKLRDFSIGINNSDNAVHASEEIPRGACFSDASVATPVSSDLLLLNASSAATSVAGAGLTFSKEQSSDCFKQFCARGVVHSSTSYPFSRNDEIAQVTMFPPFTDTIDAKYDVKSISSTLDVASGKTKDDNKSWPCEDCGKSFTTKYFLKKHRRLHTGEMPYSCNICRKNFTFQQSYHKHMTYHTDEKPYTCLTCGRSFKELSTLYNHKRIHTGEKPYACEICGKNFRQRVSYLVHKRIHSNVKPYKCTACHKAYRYKYMTR